MFHGTVTITPKNGDDQFMITGDWLYKPDTGYWYCKGSSYSENIMSDVLEMEGNHHKQL